MTKLYLVGIGPGAYEEMTLRAARVLEGCELIVGYPVYINLIRPHFPQKEYYSTPMTREAERCAYALEQAALGRSTVIVCSGDAGIYGLAGLAMELRGEKEMPDIEVVAGLTAACSGAALMGAPLSHDFAVISLSDLLTPWQRIEKRLDAAARADFCIALYNPGSGKRKDCLLKACDILLRHMSPDTICGAAHNIAREGQCTRLMTLAQLRGYEADMFTTVFIGNSQTRVIMGRMVTPRGYRHV